MEFASSICVSFLLVSVFSVARGDPLVDALNIFGDSVVDVGNNNNLNTLIKANFPPYGRDFVAQRPSGRFCNGKLATDFTGNISQGSNLSASFFGTAHFYGAISLTEQLTNYREYQTKVVNMVGKARANKIFSGAIHLLSAGSSDFIQNYYINPFLNTVYSPDQFSDILMGAHSTFIENLYGLGARRIGVTTLPPKGCLPAEGVCLQLSPSLVLEATNVLTGFFESRKSCCGTGTFETSALCNARSILHAPMLSGMDFIPLKLLTRSWPVTYFNRDSPSFLKINPT